MSCEKSRELIETRSMVPQLVNKSIEAFLLALEVYNKLYHKEKRAEEGEGND